MTVDSSRISVAEAGIMIPSDAPILLDEAEYNSPSNRSTRQREIQRLLRTLSAEFIGLKPTDSRYDYASRKLALGAAASVQLVAKEDAEPKPHRVSRLINEILPFAGAIQEPPVAAEPVTTAQVTTWLEDANTNMMLHTRAQPHDITAWSYYDRIQGLVQERFYFADLVNPASNQG